MVNVEEKKSKMILYKGRFVEVGTDATTVPANVSGLQASELIEQSQQRPEDANDEDSSNPESDPLASYVADDENLNSPNTKPWYKHELLRLGVEFEPSARADQLKDLFEDSVRNGVKPE